MILLFSKVIVIGWGRDFERQRHPFVVGENDKWGDAEGGWHYVWVLGDEETIHC